MRPDSSGAARGGWLEFADAAFARNIGILTLEEQERLGRATVAIPGLGGVGGLHLVSLVRCGVRRFHLADMDRFALVNFNRQYGATLAAVGRPKLEVMIEQARAINPHVEITAFPEGVSPENLDSFLSGVDVALDGLDFFVFEIRRKLFNRARELGIPVITAGPLGFSSALLVFTPQGMGFDRYFDIHDGLSDEDKYLRFGMGLAPSPTHIRYMDLSRVNLKRKAGPSLFPACELCAALAATEALRIVLGRPGLRPVPHYLQFDPYLGRLRKGFLRSGNRNPVQRAKIFFVSRFLLARNERLGHQPPARPAVAWRDGRPTPEALDYLARAAIAAPSGDNVQPWRMRLEEDRIEVRINRAADTSFFNTHQAASLIACGAALENMVQAAAGLGLEAVVEPGDAAAPDLTGAVGLRPGPDGGEGLAEAVWERCTNRRMFSRGPLPESVFERLEAALGPEASPRLQFVRDREGLGRLARVISLADRIRTEHRGLHEHFMGKVRWTQAEAEASRDGLPLKNLYAGAAGEVFLKATRPWTAMRLANLLGLGRLEAMHSALGIRNSPAAALLTVAGSSEADFVAGGRALERVWLTLTRLGLAVQPMTAVTLFRLHWDLDGAEVFSTRHRRLLARVWPVYDELFPQMPGQSRVPVMLFRFGQARPIRYGTYRREPETFLE